MTNLPSNIQINSFAKINLTLSVLGTRPDGFHAIESVMQSISLHDVITIKTCAEPGIHISCNAPEIPTDERNLVHKASSILLTDQNIPINLSIRIEKRIPSQAGLGGGSSNAAYVLRGLVHLLGLSISQKRLCELAAQVGSDVPFFLMGGCAHVQGRGEQVSPLPDIPHKWLVIVKPQFGVSTAWSYKRIDAMRAGTGAGDICKKRDVTSSLIKCIKEDRFSKLSELLDNDLEQPAIECHPEIAAIKTALLNSGANGALMCGSGSAVFGLFDEENTARNSIEILSKYGKLFVASTVTREESLYI